MVGTRRCGAIAALSFALVACAGGQSGTEGDPEILCQPGESHAVAPDERTALGTPRDRAAAWSPEERVLLEFLEPRGPGSASTNLTLGVTMNVNGARLVRARPSGSLPEPCPDYLTLPGVLAFETADGSFRERIDGVFHALPGGVRGFAGAVPARALAGSHDVSADLDGFVDPVFAVELWWAPGVSGTAWIRERDAGSPDAGAHSSPVTIATFTLPPVPSPVDAGPP